MKIDKTEERLLEEIKKIRKELKGFEKKVENLENKLSRMMHKAVREGFTVVKRKKRNPKEKSSTIKKGGKENG